VWFNDGTHGFQMLAPDQKLTSVVYAFRAAQAAAVDNNSITSDKIAFGAVTELKLANGAVTNGKIADFAITGTNLADGAVSAAKLGDGAVTQKKFGLGYAAGTLFDGVLTGSGGTTTTFTANFATPLSLTPVPLLSAGWTLGSASTSGFTATKPSRATLSHNGGVVGIAQVGELPAVAYEDTSLHHLRFARASNSGGTAWSIPVTMGYNTAMTSCQLMVVNGKPTAFTYTQQTNNIECFRASDAEGTSWLSSQLIDSATAPPSFTMVAGSPAFACKTYPYQNPSVLRYNRASTADGDFFSQATAITIDNTAGSGSIVSLAVINGKPAVAYSVSGGLGVRFASANDSLGATWGAPVTIDASTSDIENLTLLEVNGRPAIACYDRGQHRMIFARANAADGGSWPLPEVLVSSNTPSRCSMAILDGKPAITYFDGNTLNLLHSGDASGSSWATALTLDDNATAGSATSITAVPGGYSVAYITGGVLKTTTPALTWSAWDGTVAPLVASSVQSAGIGTAQLASGAVTLDKLDTAVRSSLLPGEGAITTSMLANFAVTTAKLDQNAVQAGQLDENAVITSKLANGAVTSDKLANGVVTTNKLAYAAVTNDKLASMSVTSQELANDSVNTNHIINGSVTGSKLEDSAVTASKIQNFTVTSLKIANNAIGSAQIANQSVTAAKLSPDALAAATFGANSVVHPSNISLNETFTFQAVSTGVLTITGGADVAEPFPITAKDAPLVPGEVLIIDENKPGHLKRSEREYDSRVAGIVSGAGGVKPGLTLRQHEVMEGSTQVALTGRVYVKADCSNGAIKPGDLITTSRNPGRAARASDAQRTPGAVIGKAMSPLDQGDGLVLILVSLQ
jgi:hypothetical protein